VLAHANTFCGNKIGLQGDGVYNNFTSTKTFQIFKTAQFTELSISANQMKACHTIKGVQKVEFHDFGDNW
jgi:hypothetical protein